VMGMTGSGKTTFISHLTGPHAEVGVGHSLSSSTIDATCYPIPCPSTQRPLYLIDTPGFDDTTRSDTSILQTIADQLTALHRARRTILGIIVLHRITDVRLAGSAVKTFQILRRICGPANYDRVVLATTMWTDASFSLAGREAAMARQ
ncbi:P-loop containing nucleoside triphosphate hydrolase protein, partial [Schizothecium vesticola]